MPSGHVWRDLRKRCSSDVVLAQRDAPRGSTEPKRQNKNENGTQSETSLRSTVCPPPIPSTRKTSGLPQCLKWVYGLLVPPFACSAFSFDLTNFVSSCWVGAPTSQRVTADSLAEPCLCVVSTTIASGSLPPYTLQLPGLRERCHVRSGQLVSSSQSLPLNL